MKRRRSILSANISIKIAAQVMTLWNSEDSRPGDRVEYTDDHTNLEFTAIPLYRIDWSGRWFTGGLRIEVKLPPYAGTARQTILERRLAPGWTEQQVSTAVNNLYFKAFDRLQLEQEIDKLCVRAKEVTKDMDFERLSEQVYIAENRTGHTSTYPEMIHDDVVFWHKWLTSIEKLGYARYITWKKGNKLCGTIINPDEGTLNPDPDGMREQMYKDGWDVVVVDPIPGIRMKAARGNYGWDV